MSSTLTGMVKRIKVPARLLSRKMALFALADSANDQGKGIDAGIDELAGVTGMSERQAYTMRSELARTGLLRRMHRGGMGAGDVATFELNVALLKAIADGTIGYADLLTPDGMAAARERMKGEVSSVLPAQKPEVTSPLLSEKAEVTSPLLLAAPARLDVESDAEARVNKHEVKGEAKPEVKPEATPQPPLPRGEVYNNITNPGVNLSLPPYPPLANGSEADATNLESIEADATEEGVFNGKSGQAAATDDDPLSQVPPSRRKIAETLLAADRHRDIVEHLLIPVLATLAIPAGRDPLTWLADWLDVAASAKVSVAALKAAAKKIRIERVRDLPAPRDLPPILQAAAASVLINLKPGDPRWAAWLAHDKRNPAKETQARLVERNRWPLSVDSDWPPETPNLQLRHDALGIRIELPPRTPEWCAHVQALRASKSLSDKEKAQSLEVDPKPIDRATRWPEVVA